MNLYEGLTILDGKYSLKHELGAGAMSSVWAAQRTIAGRKPDEVVLKFLLPELAEEGDTKARFLEEAALTTQLFHPFIVRSYEVEHWGEQSLLVMERLWGQPLDILIKTTKERGEPIPWPIAVRLISMATQAIHYAYTQTDAAGTPLRLVHRDLKPANIMLTMEGQLKIIDFGIAKASISKLKTQTGVVKGTIAYMSPEQLRAEQLDVRSDIFSLGIILFELCTGARPFQGDNFTALMFAILTQEPLDITKFRPDLPPALPALLSRVLAKDPDDRHPTALAFCQALESLLVDCADEVSTHSLQSYFGHYFPETLTQWQETHNKTPAFHVHADALEAHNPKPTIRDPLPTGELEKAREEAKKIWGDRYNTPSPQTTPAQDTSASVQAVPPDALPNQTHLSDEGEPPTAIAPAVSPSYPPQPSIATPAAQSTAPSQPPARTPSQPPTQSQPPEAARSKRGVILLVALICVLGTGGGFFVFWKVSQPSQPRLLRPFPERKGPTPETLVGAKKPVARSPVERKVVTRRTPAKVPQRPSPRPRQAPVPVPVRNTRVRRRSKVRRGRPRRIVRRTRVVRRRRVARVRPRPVVRAAQSGQVRLDIRPSCIAKRKGVKLGRTPHALLFATVGTHKITCIDRKKKIQALLQVRVRPGTQRYVKRLQRGKLRVLAIPWGRIFLRGLGKLGSTGKSYKLYEGVYTVLVFHNAKQESFKIFRNVRIRPGKMTVLKARWE